MSSAISTPGQSSVVGVGISGPAAGDGESRLDPALYRRACGRFATGITVVTVRDHDGRPHGMTVNSFSSVSLDPPLVLVSIDLRNAILQHFSPDSSFAINILAQEQEDISRRFSGGKDDRFAGIHWHSGLGGAPLLEGVLGQLECRTAHQFPAGDHTVLIGEVLAARYAEGEPLLYFSSAYRRLAP
jgi:flavin reductase (DIM6/NTAB) family NADH-FMN oxidoreductase RutF